jgi:hypothetical protein
MVHQAESGSGKAAGGKRLAGCLPSSPFRLRSRGALVAVAALLLSASLAAQTTGQGELSFQGYYLGGSAPELLNTSGVSFRFRNFMPGLGLLAGSLEAYGGQGRFHGGENYLQLRGAAWRGRHWTLTGGDFRLPSNMVAVPFYNIFYPEIGVRGFSMEASRPNGSYSFFAGQETLQEGPRIPLRVRAPQNIIGATARRKLSERLQVGARLLRLSSSEQSMRENEFFFPTNRSFSSVYSATAQALYTPVSRLKLFAETSVSAAVQKDGGGGAARPLSLLAGSAWETPSVTVRANYVYQGTACLPIVGLFVGDRRGPFAELRYRPFRRLEVFGSGSRYSNNLEGRNDVPTLRSTGESAGLSLLLPARFSANGQLSLIDFSGTGQQPEAANMGSQNRQVTASLSRPVRNHSLRVGWRDLRLVTRQRRDRQRSVEIEDTAQWRRFVFGGGVRVQAAVGQERRNTVYFRGSAQVRFNRLTAYTHIESGSDLANRTVFATNTVSSTVFGVTARLSSTWSLTAEGFRNRLTTDLNPESIFVLANQGLFTTPALGGLNQWSMFFRVSKQLHWGGPIPEGGLDRYAAEQIPLVGSVEGTVWEETAEGRRPAEGVPVVLDQARTVQTDANGRYRLPEVPEGAHRVALAVRELPAEFNPGKVTEAGVHVEVNRITRADFDVIGLTALEGRVVAPAGVAPEEILIRLAPGGRYTTPDASGAFGFYNLPEGDYQVELDVSSLPEHAVLLSAERVPVSVRHGAPPTAVEFKFEIRVPQKPVRKLFERRLNIDEEFLRWQDNPPRRLDSEEPKKQQGQESAALAPPVARPLPAPAVLQPSLRRGRRAEDLDPPPRLELPSPPLPWAREQPPPSDTRPSEPHLAAPPVSVTPPPASLPPPRPLLTPPPSDAPLGDIARYYRELREARRAQPHKDN